MLMRENTTMPTSRIAESDDDKTDETQAYFLLGPGPDSELTWLLHRAAQRLHTAVGAEAERHGLTLRDHILLSALDKTHGLTQIELGRALGMDKTTLVAELDRLEKVGLIERHADPRDRRARSPALTADGDRLRAAIAGKAAHAEQLAVQSVDPALLGHLRDALYSIINTTEDPGSCI